MQRWIFFLSLAVLLAPVRVDAQTQADIDKVAKLLEDGGKRFLTLVAEVTDEQWDFRVPGIKHTLGEEIEHIALSESDLQRTVDRALKSPARPGAEDAAKIDEMRDYFLGAETTAENFKGQNKIVNRSELEEFFPPAHSRLLKLLRGSQNLSEHFYRTGKFGRLSGLQLFYYVAFHRERHMRQMEALQSHPDMPGSKMTAD